jgi:hypothetical protein
MPRNPRSAAPDAPASLLANLGTIRAPKSARVFVLAQYPDMFTGADGKQYPHPNAGAEIMPRTPTTDGPLYAITRVSDDGRESTIRASFADLAAFAGAAKAHGLDLA